MVHVERVLLEAGVDRVVQPNALPSCCCVTQAVSKCNLGQCHAIRSALSNLGAVVAYVWVLVPREHPAITEHCQPVINMIRNRVSRLLKLPQGDAIAAYVVIRQISGVTHACTCVN